MSVCKVYEFENLKLSPERAGIILYNYYQGELFYGLGVDSKTHELTDFGGGVKYMNNEDAISAAIREFDEETLHIFKYLNIKEIKNCLLTYDNNNLIIFLHIDLNPNDISKVFINQYNMIFDKLKLCGSCQKIEICSITWLTSAQFKKFLSINGVFFDRVQNFLLSSNIFQFIEN